MKTIPDIQELIDKEVKALNFGQQPANLYEPIRYIMSLGGKRLRPMLVLLGYQLSGADVKQILRAALTVEVFHNFTLMHDDIMDAAPLRRGMPTVHEKWNSTVAILSGDTMLVKAYDLLLETDPKLLPEALRLFNKTAAEVCEGQQLDMDFEAMSSVSVEQYLEMIRLKTAVLLGFSLEYGALMGGIDPSVRKALYTAGEKMGVGFQLMDDLLDVYADQAKFGKQVGGDIIANKKTFLLIKALELASGESRKTLDQWLSLKTFDATEKVKAVTAIYDQLGIRELTAALMNTYFDEAFAILAGLQVNKSAKEILRSFAANLMKRER